MVAVGKLSSVWLDLPGAGVDLEEEELKDAFGRFFGAPWGRVMVGAEKPFAYHRYWDGYFAVTGLQNSPELTLDELTTGVDGCTKPRYYNIIVG